MEDEKVLLSIQERFELYQDEQFLLSTSKHGRISIGSCFGCYMRNSVKYARSSPQCAKVSRMSCTFATKKLGH